MIDIQKGGEISRKQVWIAAWINVASSSNCTKLTSPTTWADACLADFDKRFPVEQEPSA